MTDLIQKSVEQIKRGKKIKTPLTSLSQLREVIRNLEDNEESIKNLLESDIAKVLIENGEIQGSEDLRARFKSIKLEQKCVGISEVSDYKEVSAPPSRNILDDFIRNIRDIDAILELIDNSLDAINKSKSNIDIYEIQLIFNKIVDDDGKQKYTITIIDNGCGIKEEDFKEVIRLGRSGVRSVEGLIGTWGSGLITSAFRLGDIIKIGTAPEIEYDEELYPRKINVYKLESEFYGTDEQNRMWVVKQEKNPKKDIKEKSGLTWIQIEINELDERKNQINKFFKNTKVYEIIREQILFKLSKSLKDLYNRNKNVIIKISAANLAEDLSIKNFTDIEFLNYNENFSYNPIFPPISIKDIDLPVSDLDKVPSILEEEKPDIKVKKLTMAMASDKGKKTKLTLLNGEKVQRNGLWLWGNGRLFSYRIQYQSDDWPFEFHTYKRDTYAKHVCVHIELEALNSAGNKLIPWEFLGKTRVHFVQNFKKILNKGINRYLELYFKDLIRIPLRSLNARLFPFKLKKDIEDKGIEKIIEKAFKYANKTHPDRDKRSFMAKFEDKKNEFIEIIKALKKSNKLDLIHLDHEEFINEKSESFKKWQNFQKNVDLYSERVKKDYDSVKNKKGMAPIAIIIANLREIFSEILKDPFEEQAEEKQTEAEQKEAIEEKQTEAEQKEVIEEEQITTRDYSEGDKVEIQDIKKSVTLHILESKLRFIKKETGYTQNKRALTEIIDDWCNEKGLSSEEEESTEVENHDN